VRHGRQRAFVQLGQRFRCSGIGTLPPSPSARLSAFLLFVRSPKTLCLRPGACIWDS
jgi:hypothetical protein